MCVCVCVCVYVCVCVCVCVSFPHESFCLSKIWKNSVKFPSIIHNNHCNKDTEDSLTLSILNLSLSNRNVIESEFDINLTLFIRFLEHLSTDKLYKR